MRKEKVRYLLLTAALIGLPFSAEQAAVPVMAEELAVRDLPEQETDSENSQAEEVEIPLWITAEKYFGQQDPDLTAEIRSQILAAPALQNASETENIEDQTDISAEETADRLLSEKQKESGCQGNADRVNGSSPATGDALKTDSVSQMKAKTGSTISAKDISNTSATWHPTWTS